jgi:hypothetical protein
MRLLRTLSLDKEVLGTTLCLLQKFFSFHRHPSGEAVEASPLL